LDFSIISEPILTKFGALIGHGNPQRFLGQIFDIAPLADFWAIFPKILHYGYWLIFSHVAFFVKFSHVIAKYITNIRCEFKKNRRVGKKPLNALELFKIYPKIAP